MATPKKVLPDHIYIDVISAVELGAICKEKLETILKRQGMTPQDNFDLIQAYGLMTAMIAPFQKVADTNEAMTDGNPN